MNLDLVDEYRLVLHPIALGKGIPLLKDLNKERKLKLIQAKTFASGAVVLHYQPDRHEETRTGAR
jgi:dihydrofolate reductase